MDICGPGGGLPVFSLRYQGFLSIKFQYIAGLLSSKILFMGFNDLFFAISGSISAISNASLSSNALIRTFPSGEAIRLCPINLSNCLSFLLSSPILFAVMAYTLFSRHLTGMAWGQYGSTRFEGCATMSAPISARALIDSGKNQSKHIMMPMRPILVSHTLKPVSPGLK